MSDMRPEPDPRTRRLARQALVLLAAMTVASVGGPVLILLVIWGGASPGWPPDRPIEWAVFIGTSALVVALMILSIAIALRNQQRAGGVRK